MPLSCNLTHVVFSGPLLAFQGLSEPFLVFPWFYGVISTLRSVYIIISLANMYDIV